MNGVIPDLRGGQYSIDGRSLAQWGFVTYGSDSGHQATPGRRGGGDPASEGWALNDEAVRNLGYGQLKKTRDAAMAIVQRAYGEQPRFTYFTGTSQGGREALTVAQRYSADYDGVIANVPIVSFSSLMLAPELIRIQEKPQANWVTRAKTAAIRSEFIRQCDQLDGLTDGVINNYMACRAIFDVKQAPANRRPWAAKRCPDNRDPDPSDTSAAACLTDGQISTLEFVYSRYAFSTPLAHGVRTFGMWVPNTDPSGSGLIADTRFKGQEGAAADAPVHAHLGVLGVTGFLMRDLSANPLDYEEGGTWNRRREELSAVLDATDPDLSRFARRGGKMIVTIGTDDTLASPGAQLDYYQAVLDKMGRRAVDNFARLFVIPQANHGLMARTADVDGAGKPMERVALPTQYERFALLVDWVERRIAPGKTVTLSGGDRTLPLCSYPQYPKYAGGTCRSRGVLSLRGPLSQCDLVVQGSAFKVQRSRFSVQRSFWVAHRTPTVNAPDAKSRLLALALRGPAFACGDHAAQAQAAAERWVATWATSQTLVRGTGLGAGRGRADAPPAAATPAPAPPPPPLPHSFPGGGFRFRRTCRRSITRRCG